FYAPSSETLANEIERHKNRLEGIMNQTDRVNEISADSAGNAVDAEEKIAEITEALDMYKESQTQKELLFTEAQLENQTAIQMKKKYKNKPKHMTYIKKVKHRKSFYLRRPS